MFIGSFCICSEGDQLNYEEFELTEFMNEEQLAKWRAKEDNEDPDGNQIAPEDQDKKGDIIDPNADKVESK